jgi:puromycin-sensitive aminopeptidase
MPDTEAVSYRLPDDVVPKRYAITLAPALASATFTGQETVALNVRRSVRSITLNAAELAIEAAQLVRPDAPPLTGQFAIDEANERAMFTFDADVSPGDWELQLRFRGTLNDKLRGFYRSTYRDKAGAEHVIATTQFESTDARRAFPCWDEPAFKAVFAVTLVIDPYLTAISNGSIASDSVDATSGRRTIVFNDTMPMSTYIVAFLVGEFQSSRPVDVDGVPVRIWAAPGNGPLCDYALACGEHAVSFFSRYYGIPYPADKLDLIAVPDFAFGAMENLGAVTFRQNLLLVDQEKATHAELESIASVIHHEIAHMWFGDLVTMQWWNGIWLNEAFATFMATLAVDAFKPEWDTWTGFALDRAAALAVDGLQSTRPIEFPVRSPSDADAMFDVLTYEKGGSVLRMLEQYLTPEVFRQGVSEYLRRHAHANAETTDLWDALEDISAQPVRRVMDSWIFQPGFPLLSIERANGKLSIQQQRFLYRREGEVLNQQWQVPVVLRSAGVEQKLLLGGERAEAQLAGGDGPAVVNAGGNGVFRVRYTAALIEQITAGMYDELLPIERFGLLSDAWAAVQAGYDPLSQYLDLTSLFRDESDANVWTTLIGSLAQTRRVVGPEAKAGFEALVRDRLSRVFQRLGWQPVSGESGLMRQLRGQVLRTLGTLGNDQSAQSEARTRFGQDASTIDPDVAAAIISILAYGGNTQRYDEFWQRFKNAPTPQEERRFLFSLATFRERSLIERTLAHCLDGEIRTQDAPYVVGLLFQNTEGGELTWRFVTSNWEEILRLYPENTIIRMLEGITALSTPALANEVTAFFAGHAVPNAGKRLDQHLERMRINVDLRQREQQNLSRYVSR